MHVTLYAVSAQLTAAALGALTGAYCARAADAYVAMLSAGGEPDPATLRRALANALRRFPGQGIVPHPRRPIAKQEIVAGCMLLMAVCFAVLNQTHGYSLFFFCLAVVTATLLMLALIDAHTRLLPDALTLPLMWAGLALAWSSYGVGLHNAVAGAMLGYGFLWLLFSAFKCLSGHDGMGYGDFKLLAALGAWLGWRPLAMVLLASSLAAILFAMLRQRSLTPEGAYPFGPFLAASGTASLLFESGQTGTFLTGPFLTGLF
ncbi:hypothetical protein CR155_18060 [Pollutimonas nitritireducens]|uniref:Prepilin type IV endopeptidase peptidase domain-containing protein n=1 Tax=Pollutimonas nitritireducens TaxID=2045209 RepID=A0A2N4UBL8_9BURK|nr:A24 family peptidase [Pollutimonas nitritireducens]PLC52408.1 hypothetical protein CR155_18060 [Pollutimonas nitritireducens]